MKGKPMAQWRIKEISDLTKISVRMLRHYDALGLLKPSMRTSSGYRLYSEADLATLQQINALKFFGFSLSQIKTMLRQQLGIAAHLRIQQKLLASQAEQLALSQEALEATLARLGPSGNPDWNDLIILIERYRMNEELKKTWVAQVLTPNEFAQYAAFEADLTKRTDKKEFGQKWQKLVDQVKANLAKDPYSGLGFDLAKQTMDLLHDLYGKKYLAVRNALWEKGFKKGKNEGEHGLTPEIVHWIDKAVDYYYGKRIEAVLHTSQTDAALATRLWQELMDELYGDAQELKREMVKSIIADDRTMSAATKEWLKQFLG